MLCFVNLLPVHRVYIYTYNFLSIISTSTIFEPSSFSIICCCTLHTHTKTKIQILIHCRPLIFILLLYCDLTFDFYLQHLYFVVGFVLDIILLSTLFTWNKRVFNFTEQKCTKQKWTEQECTVQGWSNKIWAQYIKYTLWHKYLSNYSSTDELTYLKHLLEKE